MLIIAIVVAFNGHTVVSDYTVEGFKEIVGIECSSNGDGWFKGD